MGKQEDILITVEEHDLNKTMSTEELRILDICRDIEILNEQLYIYLADLFTEERELGDLWRKTANEEANHAHQFELAIRFKNEMLESVSIDPLTVATAFKFVRTLLEFAKKNPPSVADALQLSVRLEERLSRLHLECIASFKEESHKKLFRAMMAQDNRHMESLLEAQKKYLRRKH
jgi:rubrerythrin